MRRPLAVLAALAALAAPRVAMAADDAQLGAWTLLAPAVAIGLALLTRRVIPSLAAGVVTALLVAARLDLFAAGALAARLLLGDPLALAVLGSEEAVERARPPGLDEPVGAVDTGVLTDSGNLQITLFILLIAAMVGVLTRSGAMRAMVSRFEGLARGRRGAMVAAWVSGAVVFFDDYANCLVVGNAMQPVVDRFRVSRAKLAYIVDATAAPVATLAVVSTWVGYQVSVIEKGLGDALASQAFAVFVASIPYSFYSWFTLGFVGAVAISGRDFGPMADEERKAWRRPVTAADETGMTATPGWAWAPVAILLLVGVTFGWMVWTGRQALGDAASGAPLFQILEESASYQAMIVGSAVGLAVAILAALATPRVAAARIGRGIALGLQPVFHALVILFLAWTLSGAIKATGANAYLGGIVSGALDPRMLPVVCFLIAAGTAFATGSSYSTMAILVPLVVGICVSWPAGSPHMTADPMHPITLACTASILGGSCLGDHASPISDTTVLSSIGSGVDLVTHVRTQLPYVLAVGTITAAVGYAPAGFGVSPWLSLPMGLAACVAVPLILGRRPDA